MAARGSASCVVAVGVRYDMFGRGELRCGKAVVVRVGLDGSVVVSQGGRGTVRFGRVRRVGAHKRYGPAWFLILT